MSILDPVLVLSDESLEVEEVGDLFTSMRVMLMQCVRLGRIWFRPCPPSIWRCFDD
jgi:hypothetical protein